MLVAGFIVATIIMSYSTYVLNQKIQNLQYDVNTFIPSSLGAKVSSLQVPASSNILDVVDTIIVEDGLGTGNNTTITPVEVSLTNGSTTDYLSISPNAILIDNVSNNASTTMTWDIILQSNGTHSHTTSWDATSLSDGTNLTIIQPDQTNINDSTNFVIVTPKQITLYDGGINTTTIQANTTNYANGIDTLNIYPSLIQITSASGSAILAGNCLNMQGPGNNNVDCQVFNTHIDFTSSIGVVANSLTSSAWSGGIASEATAMNMNHYILGSMTSTSSSDRPQKNSNLYFNPSTQTLTSTTFSGNLSGVASSASTVNTNTYNLSNTCYIPFTSSSAGSGKALYVDDTTGPLSYNPSTSTLTASVFSGNATSATSSTNTLVTLNATGSSFYVPFCSGAGNQSLLYNNTGGLGGSALMYVPGSGALYTTSFNGVLNGNATSATSALLTTTPNTTVNYNLVLTNGTTGNSSLYTDFDVGITYNPLSGVLTAPLITGALTGNATSATTASNVLTTSYNTSTICYPVFTTGIAGASMGLFVDDTTVPLSYNPSTGVLTATNFTGSVTGTASLATTATTATTATNVNLATTLNLATFTLGTTLSIAGVASTTIKNSNIVFSGTTNTVSILALTLTQLNGEYRLGFYNGGTDVLTFNTGLGTNIKTTYATAVVIPTLRYGVLQINVLTINALTVYVVSVNLLT